MLKRSCYTAGMIKKKKTTEDNVNVLASMIVKKATEEESPPQKNPAAVALGRLGGLKGGRARAAKLSAKKRKEIAQKAAQTRWNKK